MTEFQILYEKGWSNCVFDVLTVYICLYICMYVCMYVCMSIYIVLQPFRRMLDSRDAN